MLPALTYSKFLPFFLWFKINILRSIFTKVLCFTDLKMSIILPTEFLDDIFYNT